MYQTRKLCIYHGGCPDGFGAAWVVRRRFPDTVFHAGKYGNPPPLTDCAEREVFIVDFSYGLEDMKQIIEVAKHVTLLDHHQTAVKNLGTLEDPKLTKVLDMTRSGVMLTWDFLYPNEAPPMMLLNIQDRDLWTFNFPETKPIMAYVASYPQVFSVWDELMGTSIHLMVEAGKHIYRRYMMDIQNVLESGQHQMNICGYVVPAVCIPHLWASDACGTMCVGKPFAVAFWIVGTRRYFSLRSNAQGKDVAGIAERFGGGGHKNAAGFVIHNLKSNILLSHMRD